jgi:phenylalanyl-tRNA synthetase beta chain
MRVPLSWLADFVDAGLAPQELARRLSGSGTLVEAIHRSGVPDTDGNLGRFRVGRVLSAERHPNADRLRVCTVDLGDAEPTGIVCGAPNVAAGLTVAVALPGALLPGADRPLGVATLRGVESRGMILSARELGLGDDHSGILELD